jgi:hypothetical protein
MYENLAYVLNLTQHTSIEKLSALKTELGNLETQLEMTLDASKVTCETSESQNRNNKQLKALRTFHLTLGVRNSETTTRVQ